MENKEKILLFKKITLLINKKFCKGKLVIKEINLFDGFHKKREVKGYYKIKKRIISIGENNSLLSQINTLIHELAHAYSRQISGSKRGHTKKFRKVVREFSKFIDKK
ncbi:MAG: SprT-like domain-containing protein [Nanoarchaeota archaeon]